MNHLPRRAGFTLIEGLVVVGIIGVLAALLLPSLQRVRESARRTRCANNLRQLAFGFHRHADVHGFLPSGGGDWRDDRLIVGNQPAVYDRQTWGWAYQLLPFIEQDSLWSSSDDFAIAGTPIALYSCPTLRPPTAFPYKQAGMWARQDPPRPRYMIDYVGCGGTDGGWWSLARSDGLLTPSGSDFVSLNNIPDGTSGTLLLGEKYLDKKLARIKPCCNDDTGWVSGWDSDTICFGSYGTPRRNDEAGCTCGLRFGSSHLAGMQAAFGDASVRTVGYDIDPAVWNGLVSTSDGTVAVLP